LINNFWLVCLILFLLPLYLCILAYSISYGFYKGVNFWKCDYWFFLDTMKKCKEEESIEDFSDTQLEEILKEEPITQQKS